MLKSPQQLDEKARSDIPEVNVPDIRAALDKGAPLPFLLIDVREPDQHAQGIIPGAVPMPRGQLEAQIVKAVQDRNAPIVCYCGGGTRSLLAAQQLKRAGFTNVKRMAGGFRGWVAAGNPVAKP